MENWVKEGMLAWERRERATWGEEQGGDTGRKTGQETARLGKR